MKQYVNQFVRHTMYPETDIWSIKTTDPYVGSPQYRRRFLFYFLYLCTLVYSYKYLHFIFSCFCLTLKISSLHYKTSICNWYHHNNAMMITYRQQLWQFYKEWFIFYSQQKFRIAVFENFVPNFIVSQILRIAKNFTL